MRIVVQAFDTRLITKGITGFLHQEFRELELLNKIIWSKYMCTLLNTVSGVTRSELLRSYQEYQGSAYDPENWHAVLTWQSGDALKMPQQQIWTLVSKDSKPTKVDDKVKTLIKRKRTTQGGKQSKRARHSIELLKPSAIRWDIINCCAYDALFTIYEYLCNKDRLFHISGDLN
ncbi:hypothetical protein C8J57DRAFT_1105400 [Mycena rebaudengoi]|nr:hypothetical protein C8J57DRAFT_1105400 [Mycena rebaudengoi]